MPSSAQVFVPKFQLYNRQRQVMQEIFCEISRNRHGLEEEWKELKKCLEDPKTLLQHKKYEGLKTDEEYVIIKKTELQRLCSEVMQLKHGIPKVLDKNYMTAFARLPQIQEKLTELPKLKSQLEKLESDTDSLKLENEELKARLNSTILLWQSEKQDNRSVRQELSLLTEQLTQQSEYCTGLGAACCTLLWRVSREEEAVQTILSGNTTEAFLLLIPSTLESYISAYKDDWPGEDSAESKFVLSLCGTVTNIAASAFGREFLMTNPSGVSIVDSFLKTIFEAPKEKAEKLKCLLIMALYNLTINKKGLQYLAQKAGTVQLFMWLLKDEKNGEIRLHSLHLIQSLICDDNNTKVLNEFIETQPLPLLQKLSEERDHLISQSATELLFDLDSFCSEQ